jgi:glutaconate CoA-transferase subunit A
VPRRSKLVGLAAAAELVADGDHIALGGIWSHNAPSALVRELVRRPARDLTLSAAPASGFAVDLLIAGGCATRAYLPNVTFEHLGLAPAFRRAVESGELDLVECDEAGLVAGYRAAAAGLPFQPIVSIAGTALAGASPALVPAEHSGVAVLEAPPLAPDVVFLHAQEGDVHGNVRHAGSVFCDRVMAKAAQRAVVVSVDRLVDNEEIRRDPKATTIPGYLVTHLVEAPFGAHPCSSHGRYEADEEHIRAYAEAVREDWASYRDRFVVDHPAYLEACGLSR